MKYDNSLPLIMIHIPKTAGTAARNFFNLWFGVNLFPHYKDDQLGLLPKKYDLFESSEHANSCIYGHFNKLEGFGVYDYYPKATQLVTILRNPFEMMVSRYFYMKKYPDNFKNHKLFPYDESLLTYLKKTDTNMLNYFPMTITPLNYKEVIDNHFIEVGITEKMNETMLRIANKLGKPYYEKLLCFENQTERDCEINNEMIEVYQESHPLEFAIYDYVYEKYK